MGRTFRRNDRWKKDRRDKNFRKSKKFKTAKSDHQQHPQHKVVEKPLEEDYGNPVDNS